MARVYSGDRILLVRGFGFLERWFMRLVGDRAAREQDWKSYSKTVLVFSAVFFGLLYVLHGSRAPLPEPGRPPPVSPTSRSTRQRASSRTRTGSTTAARRRCRT